jgi:hypothetical protein
MEQSQIGARRQIHSVAGDLGLNDPLVRQALHARGSLTVGLPKTIEPTPTHPSAQNVFNILTADGLHPNAPRIKCILPAPVVIVVRWWKAIAPVSSHAMQDKCVTKGLRVLWSNRA